MEYLFRGFTTEKGEQKLIIKGKEYQGEWVYGYYFCLHHMDNRTHIHHFIIPENIPIPKERPIGEIQIEVIPETVGIWTGAVDANNKKVFERINYQEGEEEKPVVTEQCQNKLIEFNVSWAMNNILKTIDTYLRSRIEKAQDREDIWYCQGMLDAVSDFLTEELYREIQSEIYSKRLATDK